MIKFKICNIKMQKFDSFSQPTQKRRFKASINKPKYTSFFYTQDFSNVISWLYSYLFCVCEIGWNERTYSSFSVSKRMRREIWIQKQNKNQLKSHSVCRLKHQTSSHTLRLFSIHSSFISINIQRKINYSYSSLVSIYIFHSYILIVSWFFPNLTAQFFFLFTFLTW